MGASCTQVAMAMTARPIMDASSTRHPNCSRMGMRILTIAQPLPCCQMAGGQAGERGGASTEPRRAAGASRISQRQAGRAEGRAGRGLLGSVANRRDPMPCGRVRLRFCSRACARSAEGPVVRIRGAVGGGQARWSGCTTRAASRMQQSPSRVAAWWCVGGCHRAWAQGTGKREDELARSWDCLETGSSRAPRTWKSEWKKRRARMGWPLRPLQRKPSRDTARERLVALLRLDSLNVHLQHLSRDQPHCHAAALLAGHFRTTVLTARRARTIAKVAACTLPRRVFAGVQRSRRHATPQCGTSKLAGCIARPARPRWISSNGSSGEGARCFFDMPPRRLHSLEQIGRFSSTLRSWISQEVLGLLTHPNGTSVRWRQPLALMRPRDCGPTNEKSRCRRTVRSRLHSWMTIQHVVADPTAATCHYSRSVAHGPPRCSR